MNRLSIVAAPGLGDAVIMHLAAFNLKKLFDVTLITPHDFGPWQQNTKTSKTLVDCDIIFLQHDNSPFASSMYKLNKPVYTFYGEHNKNKHPPFNPKLDYLCNQNQTMVENLEQALLKLFSIKAIRKTALTAPEGTEFKKHPKRVILHTTSQDPKRNWPLHKFQNVATWLRKKGYDPVILPQFETLSDLTTFIYESGFLIGNNSGPGHLASSLNIDTLIIANDLEHIRFWRPGFHMGDILTPPRWIPSFRKLRLRENLWKYLITEKSVINKIKNKII